MDTKSKIQQFLSAPAFGVVGASDNKAKFGNKVYRCYLEHDMKAYPVNPMMTEIDGNQVFPNLAALPEKVESISVITPPQVTEKIVDDAIANGVKNIWMQPGAESKTAIDKATQAGVNVIAGGPCVLVELGFTGW
jgi:predicted CoA-binding protein